MDAYVADEPGPGCPSVFSADIVQMIEDRTQIQGLGHVVIILLQR